MDTEQITYKIILDLLGTEFSLNGQIQTAKFLHLSQGRISQLKNSKKTTKRGLRTLFAGTFKAGRKKGHSEVNENLIKAFSEIKGCKTQKAIGKYLNITQGAVAQWKTGHAPISYSMALSILRKIKSVTIHPIFELKEVEPGKPGGKWYLFHDRDNSRRKKLINVLGDRRGVYCYYDSRGHLMYVGKADKTTLANEMEARLKARISHKRLPYGEGLKKIGETLRQGNRVKYVSAYEVTPREAIPLLEALLIRTTANMQFNNRLENLSK